MIEFKSATKPLWEVEVTASRVQRIRRTVFVPADGKSEAEAVATAQLRTKAELNELDDHHASNLPWRIEHAEGQRAQDTA
jgi:hypothetical protein